MKFQIRLYWRVVNFATVLDLDVPDKSNPLPRSFCIPCIFYWAYCCALFVGTTVLFES